MFNSKTITIIIDNLGQRFKDYHKLASEEIKMASGASHKGKVKPFNRGSAAVKADSKTVPYGKPAVTLQNIKDAAKESQGKPMKADIITANWKNPSKQQMENIRKLGDARYGQGDNPWKGPKAK